MSLAKLTEAQKRTAAGLDATRGALKVGLVTSFNPQSFAARVTLAAANVDVGWCDVLCQWVGAGWGVVAPLQVNDQVLLAPVGASGAVYVVIGRYYNETDTPPTGAAAGEFWLVHQTGSTLALKADGTIDAVCPTFKITGDLLVTGNISDLNGAHSTLAALRNAYDGHTHSDPQGGNTGTPSETV